MESGLEVSQSTLKAAERSLRDAADEAESLRKELKRAEDTLTSQTLGKPGYPARSASSAGS